MIYEPSEHICLLGSFLSWAKKRPICSKDDKILQNQIDFVPIMDYYIN